MIEEKDPYYLREEVSNSDLSWLQKYWLPETKIVDLEKAYAFGTLIDCMITEPHKINYFKLTCAGYQYTKEDFELAEEMKKSFFRDELCSQLARLSAFQKVSLKNNFPVLHDGFTFQLDVRCKWDLFISNFDMSADIKSTVASSQKQFEECVRYFDYDRQRAWYMDIEGRCNDMIIGISKQNCKVFKIPIKRDSDLYRTGKQKYQELAFRHWCLFGDIENLNN